MVAVTLTNLASLANQTSAITAINSNNAAITAGFTDCLSINDNSSNTMGVPLNMNSNNLINLPFPASNAEPVRLEDFAGLLTSSGLGNNTTINFAAPSGTVGLSLVAGSALTAMRSDAAPPLSQAIVPTWTGSHNFTGGFKISGTSETFPASGLIVGTTDTQTLTNKTLTSPTVNTPTVTSPSVTGTVSGSATYNTPTLAFGTGAASTISATSTNTGFQNTLSTTNSGTVATSGTAATQAAVLSGGTNVYIQHAVAGGATPSCSLSSGAGVASGLGIISGAGPVSIAPATNTQITGDCIVSGFVKPTAGMIRLSSPLSYTSNATLASTALSLSLEASTSYLLELTLFVTGGFSSGGLQMDFGASTATLGTFYFQCQGVGTGAVADATTGASTLTSVIFNGTVSSSTTGFIKGYGFITTSAAGTLTMRAAQSASNATASTVGIGSSLVAWPIT